MRTSRGFTLLEVTIVLGLVLLMVGLAAPRIADVGRLRLRTTARHLAAELSAARDAAILGGREVVLRLDGLAAGVTVATVSVGGARHRAGAPLVLHPSGEAGPTRVALADGSGRRVTVVLPVGLGRAVVEETDRP